MIHHVGGVKEGKIVNAKIDGWSSDAGSPDETGRGVSNHEELPTETRVHEETGGGR